MQTAAYPAEFEHERSDLFGRGLFFGGIVLLGIGLLVESRALLGFGFGLGVVFVPSLFNRGPRRRGGVPTPKDKHWIDEPFQWSGSMQRVPILVAGGLVLVVLLSWLVGTAKKGEFDESVEDEDAQEQRNRAELEEFHRERVEKQERRRAETERERAKEEEYN